MKSGIYIIKNKNSGKIYIGLTKNLTTRMSIHRYDHKKKDTLLYRAMRKHGFDSFTFSILEYCDEAKLVEREKFYINKFNATNKLIGYNLTLGGDGGDTFSCRDKISQNKTKDKLKKIGARGISCQAIKGQHITESCPSIKIKWKKNFESSMKRLSQRRKSGNFTESEKKGYKKLSASRTGSGNPMFKGKCMVFDDKHNLIGEFFSLKDASASTGIGECTLRKLVLGQLHEVKIGKFKGYTAKRTCPIK